MSSKKNAKPQHITDRMSKLKKQQENWISERKSSISEQKSKKQDAVLWSSNSKSEYTGFVVRKGVSTPDAGKNNLNRRPQSAVSTKSKSNRQTSTPIKNIVKDTTTPNKCEPKFDENTIKDTLQDSVPDGSEGDSLSELTAGSKYSPTSSVSIHTYREGLDEELASLNFDYTSNYSFTTSKKNNNNNNNIMQNHLCQICDSLMIDEHCPKILIPCGHSFCTLCISKEKVCPSCRNEIDSIEENHSMARVIKHSQLKREDEKQKQKEAECQKYIDEYNALNTRTDTMKGKLRNYGQISALLTI